MSAISDVPLHKPFLKWVGGKTQIIQPVLEALTGGGAAREFRDYREPFLGGGSVLLAVLSLVRAGALVIRGTVHASDANALLVNVYRQIQAAPDEVMHHIDAVMAVHRELPDTPAGGAKANRKPASFDDARSCRESHYYWLRKRFNAMTEHNAERAALFLILNKLCFRGMYREGPRGFNVPYGHYKRVPEVATQEALREASKLIRGVEFSVCDFGEQVGRAGEGDLLYLDPPYVPISATSFVGYVSDGFGAEVHERLFEGAREAAARGSRMVMSNHSAPVVIKAFADDEKYVVRGITARRAIHSKNPGSTAKEVIVSSK
jgi:DNA adenine methylase